MAAPDHDAGRDSSQNHEGAGEVVQHGIEEGAFQRDVEVRSSKGKKRAVEDRGRKRAKQERREGRGLLTHNGVSDRAEQQVGKGHEERQERERFRKLRCFSGGGKGQVGKGEVGEDAAKVADVRTGGHAADGLPERWLLREPFGKKRGQHEKDRCQKKRRRKQEEIRGGGRYLIQVEKDEAGQYHARDDDLVGLDLDLELARQKPSAA